MEADAPAYRELRLEALRDCPEVFGSDYAQNLARPASFWRERLRVAGTPGSLKIYLAWHLDEPVGLCGLALNDSPKTRHSASLVQVYVRPAWRGMGIAGVLIGACLQWARGHEVTIVKLGAATTNTSAIRCYQRCGFRAYGTEPRALCYGGVCYDELLMAREL